MTVENLITEHLDIWTSAIKTKSAAGRGSSKKLKLVGIKKLRQLILELAVRGKLVPQDPNDEPASELIKKIKEEKTRLVNMGSIKKQKKAVAHDATITANNLPQGWVAIDFGDITFNRDAERIPLSVSERQSIKGPYDYYGASGVIDSINKFVFEKSLLLIGEDGANLVNRSTPIAFIAHGKYWVNNHAHVIDGIDEEFLTYLALYINSISLLPYITGMAQPKMNQAKMNGILVLLPPEYEQKRIVAKVEELMALCDQLEAQTEASINAHKTLVEVLLATLTDAKDADELNENWQTISQHFDALFTTQAAISQLKQTILQIAVMGKLVKQDPKDEPASKLLERIATEKQQLIKDGKIKKQKPFINFDGLDDLKKPLPESWEWIKLADTADLVRGGSPRPAGDPRFYGGEIPFLKVGDVTRKMSKFVEGFNSTIKEAGLHKTRMIQVRTVLLSNSGATLGIPAICDFTATFNDGIAAFVEQSKYVFDEYLYLYLSTLSKWFLDIASQGQGQPNLNTDIIKTTWFALPPLPEQHRIVTKVDELMALCDSLKARLNQAQTTQLHLTDAIVEQALN